MNTKWLKDNALLLGLVAAFLIVIGVLVWLQQKAAGKVQEMDSSLAEQLSQYNHLREMKPPPTPENINILKQNRQDLERLYDDLLAKVGSSQIQTQQVAQPGEFLQLLASKFANLRQTLKTSGVKAPEGFAFGFSRYIGGVGAAPSPPAKGLSPQETTNVLTQLSRQLDAIEKISDLLIKSRPDEITQVRRAEVDPGSLSADALDIPVSNKGLYEVMPFEFRFAGTTDSLRNFLNSLSKSDWFFAVRSVQAAGEQPTTPGVGETGGPAPTAAEAGGLGKKMLVNVIVRIDLIEFPPRPPGKPNT